MPLSPGQPAPREAGGTLAALAALAGAGTLGIALVPNGLRDGALLPLAALAAAYAAVPLVLPGSGRGPVASAVRAAGRGLFYAVAFALAFVPVSEALRFRSLSRAGLVAALPCFVAAAAAAAAALRRARADPQARGEAALLAATVPAFAAGLFLDSGLGTAVVANMALAFLAAGRIVHGLSGLSRAAFWEGLPAAAALLATRVAAIGVPGWPRAAGAFFVVAAAFAAGLAFERRRARTLEAADVHAS